MIGKRRFVVVPEREYQQLQKKAAVADMRPEFVRETMRELRAYRKTGKANRWYDVTRRLGL
jgi:hypothetical protein